MPSSSEVQLLDASGHELFTVLLVRHEQDVSGGKGHYCHLSLGLLNHSQESSEGGGVWLETNNSPWAKSIAVKGVCVKTDLCGIIRCDRHKILSGHFSASALIWTFRAAACFMSAAQLPPANLSLLEESQGSGRKLLCAALSLWTYLFLLCRKQKADWGGWVFYIFISSFSVFISHFTL